MPTPAHGRSRPEPSTTTWSPVTRRTSAKVALVALEDFEVFERESGAADDGGLGLVGNPRPNARVQRDVAVDPAQLRPPAREDDPAIPDVRRQVRRRLRDHVAHGVRDLAERRLDRVEDSVRGNLAPADR